MFDSLTLYGGPGAAILLGHATAASLRSWRITKHSGRDGRHDGRWHLVATLRQADAFYLRQKRLRFTAPRERGWWCWPLLDDSIQISNGQLVAILGPPEQ